MYLRFVTPDIHPVWGKETGFFHATYELRDNPYAPQWIIDEYNKQTNWFAKYLGYPEKYWHRKNRAKNAPGICFFKASAKQHIKRARYATWLLNEGGIPTREIVVRSIPEIIWEDQHQVVGKPFRDLPKAFY